MSAGVPPPSPARAHRRSAGATLEPWRAALAGRDYYPTPPWATRALTRLLLDDAPDGSLGRVWEPCAGSGHMADVLRESAAVVIADDLHAYDGFRQARAAFDLRGGVAPVDVARDGVDWIVTNPPFRLAAEVLTYSRFAAKGIALLAPLRWLTGEARFATVFSSPPPMRLCAFAERVAMVEGGWDPKAKTADAHAWFVWRFDEATGWRSRRGHELQLIAPCRKTLTRADDWTRFAGRHAPDWAPPRLMRAHDDPGRARAAWAAEKFRHEAGHA